MSKSPTEIFLDAAIGHKVVVVFLRGHKDTAELAAYDAETLTLKGPTYRELSPYRIVFRNSIESVSAYERKRS